MYRREYAVMKNGLIKVVALGCFLVFLPASGSGQDSEAQAKTLAGLKGFLIVINDIGPEARSAGLSETAMIGQAESGLRAAGIRVVNREDFLASQDRTLALMGITISSVGNRAGDTFALSCFLQITQTVMLVRDPAVRAPVATWYAGGTGIAAAGVVGAEARKWLAGLMDHFLEAYKSANPRK
jgi:hypothetical protein